MIIVEVRDLDWDIELSMQFTPQAWESGDMRAKVLPLVERALERKRNIIRCERYGHEHFAGSVLPDMWLWYCPRCDEHGEIA